MKSAFFAAVGVLVALMNLPAALFELVDFTRQLFATPNVAQWLWLAMGDGGLMMMAKLRDGRQR